MKLPVSGLLGLLIPSVILSSSGILHPAFAESAPEKKPILIRLGASWCHACHEFDKSYASAAGKQIASQYDLIQIDDDLKTEDPNFKTVKSRVQDSDILAVLGDPKARPSGYPAFILIDADGKTVLKTSVQSDLQKLNQELQKKSGKPKQKENIYRLESLFGEEALAAVSRKNDDEFAAQERKGVFQDDRIPLPLAKKNQVPTPPASCQAHHAAFAQGYSEALAGQRFAMAFSTPVWESTKNDSGSLSPRSSVRQACLALRASPADAQKLDCCVQAYQQGSKKLLDYILSDQDSKDERARRCRGDFNQGKNIAQGLCESNGTSCVMVMPGPTRYLGCFHLGFMTQYASCKKTALEYLQKNLQISGCEEKKSTLPFSEPEQSIAGPGTGAGAAK